jgi:hypothetical protein
MFFFFFFMHLSRGVVNPPPPPAYSTHEGRKEGRKEGRMHRILVGKPRGKRSRVDLRMDMRRILKWFLDT